MKKNTNQLEYSLKGIAQEIEGSVVSTEIVRKDDVITDSIDLDVFIDDIKTFFNSTVNRNIELKFVLKVVDEE